MELLRVFLVGALLGWIAQPLHASPADALPSVVSVLPVWPDQVSRGSAAPEGSGVVIGDGIVATALHVVEPATEIEVRLPDGRIIPARLSASDASTDIALLSIGASLPALEVNTDVAVSDRVCALGNAFGLGVSVTCGVISALGVSDAGFNPVEDFIQTDAAVNPGMSGGALVDADGRLVGMLSAIFASDGDGSIGVSFAVSAALLQSVVDALQKEGVVEFPEPGWRLELPDAETQARIAAPQVQSIAEDGAAHGAGIRSGDLIIELAGERVRTPRDVVRALALVAEDVGEVDVVIERSGVLEALVLRFGEMSPVQDDAPDAQPEDCPHPVAVCSLRQAVFPISSFDPIGSATRISDALLVTNRHVVGDRMLATVFTPAGPREARVLPSAYPGDLVLLEVDGLPGGGRIPTVDPSVLPQGEVYALGADIARQEIRVFDPGEVIADPAENVPLGRWHVTARMQPGVSGGALVDSSGRLVGISVGGGDGRYEAIKLADVSRLLAEQEDPLAVEVTGALGTAFVACVDLVDQALSTQPTDDMIDSLAATCLAADNHGQLLEAGRALGRVGAFDAAADLHRRAVAQVPNSLNARLSLLVSLQLGARFEDMIPHARKVMEMAADDPQALRFAIQSGVWGNDPTLAEEGYQALLAADPVQAQAARRFIDSAPPAPARR